MGIIMVVKRKTIAHLHQVTTKEEEEKSEQHRIARLTKTHVVLLKDAYQMIMALMQLVIVVS